MFPVSLFQDFHFGIHLISCYLLIYQLRSLNNAFGSTILRPLTTYSEHDGILCHLKYYLSLCCFSILDSKKIRVILFGLHRMDGRIDQHTDAAEAAEETRRQRQRKRRRRWQMSDGDRDSDSDGDGG